MKTRYVLVDEDHHVYKCESCGSLHQFEADGAAENGFRFCPYCGKTIDERTGWFYIGTEAHNLGEIVAMQDAFDYACEKCGVSIDDEAEEAGEFRDNFMIDFVDWYFDGSSCWRLCYEGEDEGC